MAFFVFCGHLLRIRRDLGLGLAPQGLAPTYLAANTLDRTTINIINLFRNNGRLYESTLDYNLSYIIKKTKYTR